MQQHHGGQTESQPDRGCDPPAPPTCRQSGGGQDGGGINNGRPISLHTVAQRVLEKDQRRGGGQHQHEHPSRLVTRCILAARCRNQPGHAQHPNAWGYQSDLPADELCQIPERTFGPPISDTAALFQETHPPVVGVPDQNRKEYRQTQHCPGPRQRTAQPAAAIGRHQDPYPDAEPQEDRGVFAGQRPPSEGAREKPPPCPGAAGDPDRRPDRRAPEEQKRRVRGHGDRSRPYQQRRVPERTCDQPGALVGKQTFRRIR